MSLLGNYESNQTPSYDCMIVHQTLNTNVRPYVVHAPCPPVRLFLGKYKSNNTSNHITYCGNNTTNNNIYIYIYILPVCHLCLHSYHATSNFCNSYWWIWALYILEFQNSLFLSRKFWAFCCLHIYMVDGFVMVWIEVWVLEWKIMKFWSRLGRDRLVLLFLSDTDRKRRSKTRN